MISQGLFIFSCVLDGMLDLGIQRYKQKLAVFKRSSQSKKWGEDLKKWSEPFLLRRSGLRGKVLAKFGGEADEWVGQFCITEMKYRGQANFIKEGIWLGTNCTVLSLGRVPLPLAASLQGRGQWWDVCDRDSQFTKLKARAMEVLSSLRRTGSYKSHPYPSNGSSLHNLRNIHCALFS